MAQSSVELVKKQDLELKSVLEELDYPEITLSTELVEGGSQSRKFLKFFKKDNEFKELRSIESVKNVQNYRLNTFF